jgi:hypothetical protein
MFLAGVTEWRCRPRSFKTDRLEGAAKRRDPWWLGEEVVESETGQTRSRRLAYADDHVQGQTLDVYGSTRSIAEFSKNSPGKTSRLLEPLTE